MYKPSSIGVVLAALLATHAAAVPSLPRVQANPVAVPPRTGHAILRYGASATADCRSLSDTSSELCILLALHVIRMSEKPLAGAAL